MLCIKAKLLINESKAPAYVSGPIPSPSLLPTAHQPHWPSFCPANVLCSFLPESPDTGCYLCLAGSSLSPLLGSFLSFRSQLTWEHILSPVSSSHPVITTSPFSNSLHSSLLMTCLVCPRHLYAYCQVWLLITPHSFSNVGNKFYGQPIYKNLIFVWLWLAYCLFSICSLTYILCASELSFDYLSAVSTVPGTWKIQGSKEGSGEREGGERGREGEKKGARRAIAESEQFLVWIILCAFCARLP